MKEMVIAVLAQLVRSIFESFAQNLWDGLWEEIFVAVVEAEEKWEEGYGEKKKKFVEEWILNYIDKQLNEDEGLGWIQTHIIKIFVSRVVDSILDSINKELGHDWLKRAKKAKDDLGNIIPIVS